MKTVDPDQAAAFQKLIDHNAHSIQLWLRKLGYTTEQRKAFWMELSDRETDELDYTIARKPPTPVQLVHESGDGMTQLPGLVLWNRPYPIDLKNGYFPFDFPVNQAQVLEFRKSGFQMTLLPDGTGFSFTALNGSTAADLTEAVERLFNFEIFETTREAIENDRANRERKPESTLTKENARSGICTEDAPVGGIAEPSCPT